MIPIVIELEDIANRLRHTSARMTGVQATCRDCAERLKQCIAELVKKEKELSLTATPK